MSGFLCLSDNLCEKNMVGGGLEEWFGGGGGGGTRPKSKKGWGGARRIKDKILQNICIIL